MSRQRDFMTPADALARAVHFALTCNHSILWSKTSELVSPCEHRIALAEALAAYEVAPKGVVVCEGRCDPLDLEWRENFREAVYDLGLNGERIRLVAEKVEDGDV